jgi:hypothetical protein
MISFIMPPVSPIFKAVREKRCNAWETRAKRSPPVPASALARDAEPSKGETRGGPPAPPSASPRATLRGTARRSGEPCPVGHARPTDRRTLPRQPLTAAAPRTPPASRPVAPSLPTASAPWPGRLGAPPSGCATADAPGVGPDGVPPARPCGRPPRRAHASAALRGAGDGHSASPTGAPRTPRPPRPRAPPPERAARPAQTRAAPSPRALDASWGAGRRAATQSPRRGGAGLWRAPPRVRSHALHSAGDLARAG